MYYLIISGVSSQPANIQRVSFGNKKADVCFGHTKPNVIPEYSLEDYLNEFGNEVIDTYERDKNYKLIPCKKNIIDALAEWNNGAK